MRVDCNISENLASPTIVKIQNLKTLSESQLKMVSPGLI
jgi:hypothetical protein